MAEKVLSTAVHRNLLTDPQAQERAAEAAILAAMKEHGLTREQAELVYGVGTPERREI